MNTNGKSSTVLTPSDIRGVFSFKDYNEKLLSVDEMNEQTNKLSFTQSTKDMKFLSKSNDLKARNSDLNYKPTTPNSCKRKQINESLSCLIHGKSVMKHSSS